MSTSEKKAAANQINGQKSHGPTNTASTRFNATQHGLRAVGITELDDAEGYRAILDDLRKEKAPVGIVETILVETAALDMVRLRRARRLEAEYITSVLNPPTIQRSEIDLSVLSEPTILDPGLPAAISLEGAQGLVNVFQRYESTITSRLIRTLHELERQQRLRQGENLPAPVAVDVDVNVHADAGIVDSVPAAFGQRKALPSNEE